VALGILGKICGWARFKVLRRLRQLAGPPADQSAGKPRTHLLSDQA
jgi:hypothetical protein